VIPRDEQDIHFGRDVKNILRGDEVGLRWKDNVGPERTIDYLDARVPYTVLVELNDKPRAVLCLDGQDLTDRKAANASGATVEWLWVADGIRVSYIDVPATTHLYRVTLGIVKG